MAGDAPFADFEFTDEETGPPLSKTEITRARESLAQWQSPAVFRRAVEALCKRCTSADWFNRPDLKFLHDAFVIASLVHHRSVDQVRLAVPSDQWPDGHVRIGDKVHNVEVTSASDGRPLSIRSAPSRTGWEQHTF
jgi:hypothetical protein